VGTSNTHDAGHWSLQNCHFAGDNFGNALKCRCRVTVYKNCPLPTPEDRLLFILVYLKTYALQVVHGRLFGMVQGKANQWIHVLLPSLLAALRALGDAPARSLTALAQRLGVSEADAATVVTPLAEAPAPLVAVPAAVPASPLLPMMAPNGASSALKTVVLTINSPAVTHKIATSLSHKAYPGSRRKAYRVFRAFGERWGDYSPCKAG
jgi:Helix-turn-helix of DDE superfamily endonuclease